MLNDLESKFLLDPNIIFLNHGSFGACPASVFEVYQRYQLEMERQPVAFLGRRYDTMLDEARERLGAYLNAKAQDIIFVTNATSGINLVARSLNLQPGDEILTTDHEYGAVDKTWKFVCRKTGATIVRYSIPLPVTTHEELIESFWEQVTPQTKVIALSHITSPTALTLPITAICRRAREAGILTVIDGAHAPGQIPVDLEAIGADFYSGNCHKWICAPKGAGFLYAQQALQDQLDPLVISWGWDSNGASFVTQNQWQGTRDVAAFLTIPAAIDFLQENNWDAVRENCHALVRETRRRISSLTGIDPISPDSSDWFTQMATVFLPDCDPDTLKTTLYDDFHIEIPEISWQGNVGIRISFQGYNTQEDADALVNAITQIFDL